MEVQRVLLAACKGIKVRMSIDWWFKMTPNIARKKLNSLMLLSYMQGTDYLEALAMGMQALDERNKCRGCEVYETGTYEKLCDNCSRKYEDKWHAKKEVDPLVWKTKHCKDCKYFSSDDGTCDNPYILHNRSGNHKRPSDPACVRGFMPKE